tara:strand:+ start:99 stop:326 length:228 start_codon:yes stop_codon:yes gene_type:complete
MGGPVRRILSPSRPAPAPAPAPRPKPSPKPEPIKLTATDPKYDKSKRRGRRSTILTGTEGADDQLDIQLKTLLGG